MTVADETTRAEQASPSTAVADRQLIVIEPTQGWAALRIKDIWEFRELMFFLIWRDVKVRYRQTFLGTLWVVIQPFMLMVVFSLVLGRLAHLSSATPHGIPYPVLVFAGLVPWTLFSSALSASSESLVGNANLVSKIYFPRLLLPFASATSFVLDFLLSLIVLVGMMAFYDVAPGIGIVVLPLLALFALFTAVGVGMWLTALNVRFRDVRYLVPFLIQIWLFASPVAYWADKVPAKWRLVYAINPMAGVVEGFRWALLGLPWSISGMFAVSAAVSATIFLSGVFFFRRVERGFADVI